jgi:hypothetical protein
LYLIYTVIFKFPFDTQICPIKIGLWQHDKHKIAINVVANYSSLFDFTENPVWKVVEANSYTVKSASR